MHKWSHIEMDFLFLMQDVKPHYHQILRLHILLLQDLLVLSALIALTTRLEITQLKTALLNKIST